jgi:hypothetical protein
MSGGGGWEAGKDTARLGEPVGDEVQCTLCDEAECIFEWTCEVAAADGGTVQAVKQLMRADEGRLLEVKPQTVNRTWLDA